MIDERTRHQNLDWPKPEGWHERSTATHTTTTADKIGTCYKWWNGTLYFWGMKGWRASFDRDRDELLEKLTPLEPGHKT